MRAQPLSLALVIMNFALLGYLFYRGHHISEQQVETTRLFANCVPLKDMQEIIRGIARHEGVPIPGE